MSPREEIMRKPSMSTAGISIFVAVILMALYSSAWAEKANIAEMESVCRNWLTHMTYYKGEWGGSPVPEISSVQDLVENDTLLARVFFIRPNGYVVVPVLKELPPVQAYSDENGININDPEGFPALLREVLLHRIRLYVQIYGSLEASQPDTGEVLLDRTQRQEWNRFQTNSDLFKANLSAQKYQPMEQFGPLLTTSWHQGFPYNNYCPAGDGGRTVVGCVATATSQILAYHRWPLQGSGTHTYWWGGDNSCGGSSPGALLTADYSDPYDWDNIVDYCNNPCPPATQNALAELCSEVGVAFNMEYGRCGSGAYTSDAQNVFPTYFRYFNHIQLENRTSYSQTEWSDLIRTEIAANRPIQYRIMSHSIVADGWQEVGKIPQVHMNYGWAEGHTTWYSIDQLYCNWQGCSYLEEFMLTHIEPDRGLFFAVDTSWGQVPIPVNFTGTSTVQPDSWKWAFGDGDSAFVQSPTHLYTRAGRYNVTVQTATGSETKSYTITNCVTALADTMRILDTEGEANTEVVVTISGSNTIPLRRIMIPISYAGPLDLTYDSCSVVGCRTETFDKKNPISDDPTNKRMTFAVYCSSNSLPDLAPGDGPVLKVYFRLPAYPSQNDSALIEPIEYDMYKPLFAGPALEYIPGLRAGMVCPSFMCGDANSSENVNISDITALINYLYRDGTAPLPVRAADVNNSNSVNIADVTYLINFLYKSGAPLKCM